MSLVLPPRVQAEINKEKWRDLRAEDRAEVRAQLDFDDPVCKEWQKALRELDPRLSMGRGKAGADRHPIREGFYHFVMFPDNAPVSVMEPITKPDGESFAYPDSGDLEALKAADLQNPRVIRDRVDAKAERERERAAEVERDRADRRVHARERVDSATRTFVSLDRSVPWTQNAAGKRGAGRA